MKWTQGALTAWILLLIIATRVHAESMEPIFAATTKEKIIALTFDDGPKPQKTTAILEILQKEHIPATFFLVGLSCMQYPNLVREIALAGHELGNHTFHHTRLDTLSQGIIRDEVEQTNELIANITGRTPRVFRPPGGRFNRLVLDSITQSNVQPIYWNVNSFDYFPEEASRASEKTIQNRSNQIARLVLRKSGPGSIILMHNGNPYTIRALPEIIQTLKQHGYRFVTVTELLKHTVNGNGMLANLNKL